MIPQFENDWDIQGEIDTRVGFAITDCIASIANEDFPQFADLFPFNSHWVARTHFGSGSFAITLESRVGSGVPSFESISDQYTIASINNLFFRDQYPSFKTLRDNLGSDLFGFTKFIYVGSVSGRSMSWKHIHSVLFDWLNEIVLPVVHERNRARVLSAIPSPPSYDPQAILSNTYVLESDVAVNQGTCFLLKGIGLVTCHHVLQEKTKIFESHSYNEQYLIEVKVSNDEVDLAVINASGFKLQGGLEIGSSHQLQVMDHIAAIGFPNYNYFDTGIFSPGLVIGFRTFRGVRRILTNIPLIAGNSGGPVIDKTGKVIGVVVTGADIMENAGTTENHGIIPIEMVMTLLKMNEKA